MKKYILLLALAILSFSEVNAENYVCTMDAKMCSDGSFVWRTWPNCEFEKCSDEVEKKACTREYMPVCWEVQVQCIKAPCYPIMQTFSNKCELWNNSLAKFVWEWTCESISKNNLKNKIWIKNANNIEKYLQNKTKNFDENQLKKYYENLNSYISWKIADMEYTLTIAKFDEKWYKKFVLKLNALKYIQEIIK